MKVTQTGTVINNVITCADSISYKDFLAFQDEDGAIVHMRKTEITKLYNYMLQQQSLAQQPPVVDQTNTTQKDLDSYFN